MGSEFPLVTSFAESPHVWVTVFAGRFPEAAIRMHRQGQTWCQWDEATPDASYAGWWWHYHWSHGDPLQEGRDKSEGRERQVAQSLWCIHVDLSSRPRVLVMEQKNQSHHVENRKRHRMPHPLTLQDHKGINTGWWISKNSPTGQADELKVFETGRLCTLIYIAKCR